MPEQRLRTEERTAERDRVREPHDRRRRYERGRARRGTQVVSHREQQRFGEGAAGKHVGERKRCREHGPGGQCTDRASVPLRERNESGDQPEHEGGCGVHDGGGGKRERQRHALSLECEREPEQQQRVPGELDLRQARREREVVRRPCEQHRRDLGERERPLQSMERQKQQREARPREALGVERERSDRFERGSEHGIGRGIDVPQLRRLGHLLDQPQVRLQVGAAAHAWPKEQRCVNGEGRTDEHCAGSPGERSPPRQRASCTNRGHIGCSWPSGRACKSMSARRAKRRPCALGRSDCPRCCSAAPSASGRSASAAARARSR